MEKYMTGEIIDLIANLKLLNKNDSGILRFGFVKRYRKKKLIKAAHKNIISSINKEEINALDIIDFGHLVSTSKMIDHPINNLDVMYRKDHNTGLVSSIIVIRERYDENNNIQMAFKSSMNETGGDEKIDAEWLIYPLNSKLNDVSKTTTYSRRVKCFTKKQAEASKQFIDVLIADSYGILYNTFIIGIEEIFDSIKDAYLK